METQIYTAWNPNTEQEYEVELPTPEVVRQIIPELDYQPSGLSRREVAAEVAERLQLSDEQKNARNKSQVKRNSKDTIWRDVVISGLIKQLKQEGILDQPAGSMTPYFPAESAPLSLSVESDVESYLETVPEESIEQNYHTIQKKLAADLLEKIKNNTPGFFEKLVIDLLVKMGYGGSRENAGRAVGRSGDGGIDGIINEDRLGLDMIYVQAKRWEGNVGEPPVRDFVGALDGEGVQKGVFIITSHFSPAAKNYALKSSKRIILIDGKQLTQLMIEHNVGVSVEKTYEIKRIDSDYFVENAENS